MKLLLSFIAFAIAGIFAPAAMAEQQGEEMERGPVARVQSAQTQQTKAQYDRIVGVCSTAEAGEGGLAPVSALQNYFSIIEKKVIIGPSTVTVLEMPKHGELYDRGTMINRNGKLVDSGERSYYYTAKSGYLGEERVVFLVEMGGMKAKVVYSLHVTEISDDEVEGNYCPVPYKKLGNSAGGEISSLAFLFNSAQQNVIGLKWLGSNSQSNNRAGSDERP